MAQPRSILLVEEKAVNAEALAWGLRHEGVTVECASSEEEAWQYLQRGGRPALIILHHLSREGETANFLMRLRADPQVPHIPVLVIAPPKPIRTAADFFFSKPVEFDAILALIRRIHQSSLAQRSHHDCQKSPHHRR
jgi:CheY-like chemotaxis protein